MDIINIIGRGNVASHLAKAFEERNVTARIVNPHTLDGLETEAMLTLISVSDDAIPAVAAKLRSAGLRGIVAHTSGSTPLEALATLPNPTGVFYPLQTFSKDEPLDYDQIPFFIEACGPATLDTLREYARLISPHVREADSARRRDLHIASVFACNFANHLWALAEKYLEERGLPFDVLMPLIAETVKKTRRLSPYDAQTGPAVRGDMKIIGEHLVSLADHPELREIYKTMTQSIINHHKP